MGAKTCFRCGIERPLSEFYKHAAMNDGHLNKCKECTCAEARANRTAKVDYYRAYDRVRYAHHGLRGEASDDARQRASKSWSARNRAKRRAYRKIQYAVAVGSLVVPKSCSGCRRKTAALQAHHEDYNKPLEVRWLCSKCHALQHRRFDVVADLAVLQRGPRTGAL